MEKNTNLKLIETLYLQRMLYQKSIYNDSRHVVLKPVYHNIPIIIKTIINPFVLSNALVLQTQNSNPLIFPDKSVPQNLFIARPPLIVSNCKITLPKNEIFKKKAIAGKIFDKIGGRREYIDQVRDVDVLCGRGGKSVRHPGNRKYREIVNEMKASYRNKEKRAEKASLSRVVVERVRNYGGCFVRKDENTQRYYVLSQEEARRKTSQALREQNDEEIIRWKKNGAGRVSAFIPKETTEDQRIYVDTIHDLDIICGRGGQPNNHPGNKIYRQIITDLKKTYKNTKETSKKDLSQMIVNRVLNYGGRFVHRDFKGKPRYFLLAQSEARKKTSQALRDTKK